MAVMAVWAAVLITYGVSKGIAMDPSKRASGSTADVLPLDMAPNSVDDMYDGCNGKMKEMVLKDYLQNEKNMVSKFKNAWEDAEKFSWSTWNNYMEGNRKEQKEQLLAIQVYTSGKEHIYADFNDAVRSQKSEYMTTFQYHTLHFFLTVAVQTNNVIPPKKFRCLKSYRRTDKYFSQDVLNKEIRLGFFVSSSLRPYPNPEIFGKASCFEIYTCFGADISMFSKFGDAEGEVLIPPYEVFKVTEIKKRSKKEDPCDVMYKLKSTRTLSNLNCAYFK